MVRLFHCFPVEGGADTASLMSTIEFREEPLGLAFLWNCSVFQIIKW